MESATILSLVAQRRGENNDLIIFNSFMKSVYFKHVLSIFFSPRHASVEILTNVKNIFVV